MDEATKLRLFKSRPEVEATYQDILDLLRKRAGKVDALEMLAAAANVVGKIIAMQDQREVTPQEALEIVTKNIEHGNQQMMARLKETQGRA